MQISLIISTYNWPQALDLVLKSVARQRRMPDEVVVADDGSGAETAQLIASWSRRLGVPLRHVWQVNEGFRAARSRNLAIAAALGEYVILIDGDMVLNEHFVADHEQASERGCFVQGVRIRSDAGRTRMMLEHGLTAIGPFVPGIRNRHYAVRSPWLSRYLSSRSVALGRIKSCNQGYWRSDLIAVNGFEERMVGWGPEDKECAMRLMHLGVRCKHLRFAALAVHLHHASRAPEGVNPNDAFLAATIASRRTRCDIGLDQRLTEFAAGIPASARPPWSA